MFNLNSWVSDSGINGGGLFTALHPLINNLNKYSVNSKLNTVKISDSGSCWDSITVNQINLSTIALVDTYPSINHTHGLWGIHSMASYFNSLRSKYPLVISPHGMLDPWAMEQSSWKKRLASYAYENGAFSKATYIHALTSREASDIKKNFTHVKRIEVIPNGVDMPVNYKNTKGLDNSINILYMARLHSKKGIIELVKAWAKFQENPRNAHINLTVAGWGDEFIEGKLKGANLRNLHFVGKVFGDKKINLLRNSHFFILPSFSEGLPISILEAWSYGLPTIMTDDCNLECGFESNAAIKILPEVDSILKGLNEVKRIDSLGYKELSHNAYSLAANRFNWADISLRHFECYKGVL